MTALNKKLEVLRELVHDPEVRPYVDPLFAESIERLVSWRGSARFCVGPRGSGKSSYCARWASQRPDRTVIVANFQREMWFRATAARNGLELQRDSVIVAQKLWTSVVHRDLLRRRGSVCVDDFLEVLRALIGTPDIRFLTHRTGGKE